VTGTEIFLAYLGALVATVLAVIEIRRHLRERARILIRVAPGFVGLGDGEKTVIVNVENSGKRPITLTYLTFELKDGSHSPVLPGPMLLEGPSLPHRLAEGDAAKFIVLHRLLELAEAEANSSVVGVMFTDGGGRKYRQRLRFSERRDR
jgi:hypothetical protein